MGVPVIGDVPKGGAVVIDGFWSAKGVVATRVTPTERGLDQVTGRFDPEGSVGTVRLISGLATNAEPGEIVTVKGMYQREGFTITESEIGVFRGTVPDLLLAEGFFDKPNEAGDATLLTVNARMALDTDAFGGDQKIRRCALNGRFDYVRSALSAEDAQIINDFCISAVR